MVPTFSNPTKVVTVTASLPGDRRVSDYDVRTALQRLAQDNGVEIRDLTVSVADGPRTVTLTEDEYNALTGQSNTGA